MKSKLAKTLNTKVKKLLAVTACATLVLSLGVTAAFAAASANVKPENVITSADGCDKLYVNLDENGVPIPLTAEDEASILDLIALRDTNGNIIPSDDGLAFEIKVLGDSNFSE